MPPSWDGEGGEDGVACEYSLLASGASESTKEASAIAAEKFHTDDNLPRIQASLPNNYSPLYSCITTIISFVWVEMADSVNRELTADLKLLLVTPEFWADWRQQYGLFRLGSQTLLSGDSEGPRREAAVFAGKGGSCSAIWTFVLNPRHNTVQPTSQ